MSPNHQKKKLKEALGKGFHLGPDKSGSTQPPVMEDAGNGMARRMLVLKPRNPEADRVVDPDLDEKLEAELGEIVSWALQVSTKP